ncbi:hypothetical protein [Pontiella agarivorans]|uniref:Outer membrane protein beta-barrel domain-containing protein n=1 Tax=Pontiella agarivorans TaxID=3038953 RepID=A0ABU5MZC3_9BACT|nr:hypothetical protein [Pontiella agarivorans]MDZ8119550.1 hypothetical protein [Pontiella agarivorans]
MKKLLLLCTALIAAGCALADTSLSAYGTYWEADSSGQGAGLRLKKTFLGFGAVEARGGYVNFDDIETDMIPLDASINVRLPFMISPYAGVGAGYYFMDSDAGGMDDTSGVFAQIGVEATFLWIGALAEVRYYDLEENYFDGPSYNIGLLLKW